VTRALALLVLPFLRWLEPIPDTVDELVVRIAADRVKAARDLWRDVERVACEIDDPELAGRVDCARLAILDAADRADQLLEAAGA
jgi:hypothetical protein